MARTRRWSSPRPGQHFLLDPNGARIALVERSAHSRAWHFQIDVPTTEPYGNRYTLAEAKAEVEARLLRIMAAAAPAAPVTPAKACDRPDAHDAHMALNGECPWCGAVDEAACRPDLTLEQIEAMYG